MAKSKESFAKAWAQIVARTWVDEEFKKKLLKNPEKVLKEMGIAIPTGVKLELHEQKTKKIHLILPAKPVGVLTEQELKAVAAGATPTSQCSSSSFDSMLTASVSYCH